MVTSGAALEWLMWFLRLPLLHGELRLQTLPPTEDGHERERAAVLAESKRHIARARIPLLLDAVPRRRVADIVYRDIVLLRPEERYAGEALPPSQHVVRH